MIPRAYRPTQADTPQTVRAVIDAYLRHSVANAVHCQEALEERRRILSAFADHAGDLLVSDCRAYMLADWIDGNPRWKSVSTRRAKANMIRAAFNWALDQERIDRNPFAKVRYAEAERRPEFPDDLLERMARVAGKQFEAVLRFLRLTGCRISELCRARWADMDVDAGAWTIHRHKSRRYTQRPKVVALVPEAVGILAGLKASCLFSPPPDMLVFVNSQGRAWNRRSLCAQMERLKVKCGINHPASLHGIRHRAASAAIVAGAALSLVAAQLGHASTNTTSRYYVHLNQQIPAIRDAMSKGVPRRV